MNNRIMRTMKRFLRQLPVRMIGLSVVLVLLLSSCEQVISVDLNQAAPQVVIEGIVTDQSGPYSVTLSKSGNYFEPSLFFPPVSNALVVLSDDLGDRDTLKEGVPGIYQSSSIFRGTPGRTYTLKVETEGQEFDGSSRMPQKVSIDSLFAVPRRSSSNEPGYDIYLLFNDPPEPGNYYRVNVHVSNSQVAMDSIDGRRYRLYSDKLINGNEASYRVRARRTIVPGDTITVDLLSLDKSTYDYYLTLNNILTSDRSPTSLSPANPNTNLSNGSLGYFAAYAVDSKKVVLR
jgi:hypothetical protein